MVFDSLRQCISSFRHDFGKSLSLVLAILHFISTIHFDTKQVGTSVSFNC